MKKFTFLLAFCVISLMANAQISKNLQNKIEKAHEKYLKFSEMVKYAEKQTSGKTALLKSTAATQKLDSIVYLSLNEESFDWFNESKDEYYYDSEMKSTMWKNSEWSFESNSWFIWSQTDIGYDNNDMVNSIIFYNRDVETDPLIQFSKMIIYNGSTGLQDSILMYSKTELDTWVLETKQIHHYNASKQLIKTDLWAFDEDAEGLIMAQSHIYAYTESGKIKTISTMFNFGDEQIPFSKTEYSYDGSDNLISEVISTLDFETLQLKNSSRNTYKHIASGKVSESVYESWEGGVWVKVDKTESQFNSAGDVTFEIYSVWNGTAWIENEKDEYLYGATNFSDVVFPNFYILFGMEEGMEYDVSLMFNKIITGMKYYELIDGSWIHKGSSTFYYSSGTPTKINETITSHFSVYPNPAAESVSFKWNGNSEELTLEMYQITGAKVMEKKTLSGKSVSLSNLEDGVYFYKLMDGKETVHSGKLIKK